MILLNIGLHSVTLAATRFYFHGSIFFVTIVRRSAHVAMKEK